MTNRFLHLLWKHKTIIKRNFPGVILFLTPLFWFDLLLNFGFRKGVEEYKEPTDYPALQLVNTTWDR